MAKCHVAVAGGAGYIGSHTVVELLQKNFQVTVLDNMVNSSEKSLENVLEIVNGDLSSDSPLYKTVDLIKIDLATEPERLVKLFKEKKFDAVIHFAGLKAVGESVEKPLDYYKNNLNSTLNLVDAMEKSGCLSLIASSSATVYGDPEKIPITEDCLWGLGITNPYGKTKMMLEHILQDCALASVLKTKKALGVKGEPTDEEKEKIEQSTLKCVLLRYFNPVGAHPSGLIGEDPKDIPNNLMPYISQVAVGRREKLSVFGNDYDTVDGTGVRDYLHVVDLARGHVAALERVLLASEEERPKAKLPNTWVYNLGRGEGISVLEMLEAMRKASGKPIPHVIVGRRAGDIATCYCDPALANTELAWKCENGVEKICEDTWRWQSSHPDGYDTTRKS